MPRFKHVVETEFKSTSHPAMIGHRIKSDKWAMTRKPGHTNKTSSKGVLKAAVSSRRLTASFEYIGY